MFRERIHTLRTRLEQQKGKRDQFEKMKVTAERRIKRFVKSVELHEEAQQLIQTVARQTQEQLQYHISELITLALSSVFNDPYEFEVDFVERRGRTECDLYFVRDGNRINPLDGSGGGAVDLAALALQFSLWTLQIPRSRNVLILDEPLKWLKGSDLPKKGALVIKEISERLGIQIIMVSHSPELIEAADRAFLVSLKKGRSNVEVLS